MKQILSGILLLNACLGFSQETTQGPLELNIQQAIDLGLKNRYDVKSKKYDLEISQNEVSKSRKEWIPEISASGNVRYSPDLQSTFIPGGFFTQAPSLVSLGANSLSIFGLDLNQTIYKPGIETEMRIAKNKAALSQEQNRQEENRVKEQIVLAYLNVTLKELQYKIVASEESRFKEYAELFERKLKAGSILETDYLKAKLDHENAKVETRKARQNYELAIQNIKYQINIPENTAIFLTDTLNALSFDRLRENTNADTANRTEIKQIMLKQEGLKLDLSKTRAAALPSIAFYANYSKQFSYTNLDYSQGQWWSTFNYVGIQFKIPITSNYKNHNNIVDRKIRLIQNDLDLKQKQADVKYEIEKASTEIENAQQNMQVTKSNYVFSQTLYKDQKQQYGLGSRQYSDLLETNRSLNQAEQNYIKAVYDYLIAEVNYQKAIGVF